MDSQHFAYVRKYLTDHDGDRAHRRPGQMFRTRSSHIARVAMWLERLLAQGLVDDPEPLRLAVTFHDVGYAHSKEEHARYSADILRAYGDANGLPKELLDRAVFLVAEHSNKDDWLPRKDAPRDLILLMEADLLDEEGAMGLVVDCMTAGALGAGYEDALAQMRRYEPKRLAHNPMVTPLARQFWAEKQALLRLFLHAFAFDLGEPDEA